MSKKEITFKKDQAKATDRDVVEAANNLSAAQFESELTHSLRKNLTQSKKLSVG